MSELEIECSLVVMREMEIPLCATETLLDFAARLLKALEEERTAPPACGCQAASNFGRG